MSKHTPGPWAPDNDGRSVEALELFGIRIAFCGAGSVHDQGGSYAISQEEAKANARLIAAAPSLLEAAHVSIRRLEYLGAEDASDCVGECPALTALRAAIAKAEGK